MTNRLCPSAHYTVRLIKLCTSCVSLDGPFSNYFDFISNHWTLCAASTKATTQKHHFVFCHNTKTSLILQFLNINIFETSCFIYRYLLYYVFGSMYVYYRLCPWGSMYFNCIGYVLGSMHLFTMYITWNLTLPQSSHSYLVNFQPHIFWHPAIHFIDHNTTESSLNLVPIYWQYAY